MNKNNRSERATIRIRPDILEIAEDLKREYKYSKADIFEMGVLMLDHNQGTELILQDKILSEMISRFSKIEKQMSREFEKVQKNILGEIDNLKKEQESNFKSLESRGLTYGSEELDSVVDGIIGLIKTREENNKHDLKNEPMGREYFEYKMRTTGVPVDTMVGELEKRGYGYEKLMAVSLNPKVKVRRDVESGADIYS